MTSFWILTGETSPLSLSDTRISHTPFSNIRIGNRFPYHQQVPLERNLRIDCRANSLPSTGQENNRAQPKAGKCPSSTSHFSPFNCRLSVVL